MYLKECQATSLSNGLTFEILTEKVKQKKVKQKKVKFITVAHVYAVDSDKQNKSNRIIEN